MGFSINGEVGRLIKEAEGKSDKLSHGRETGRRIEFPFWLAGPRIPRESRE